MSKAAHSTQTVFVNGQELMVPVGITVAAALNLADCQFIRRSRLGQARGALCGMGICYECRANINGQPHQRTCLVACEEGMRIQTDA
jgi:sarcosine oxidase subunit alpha